MQQPNTIVVTRPVYSTVDDTDPRYRCCCGCMSVVTGAIIIGILEILGALSNIGGLIAEQAEGRTNGLQGSIYYGIIGAVVTITLVVLLFVGISKEHPGFVLPHLILQIIGIVLMIIGGIVLIITVLVVGVTATASQEHDSSVVGAVWGLMIFVVIALFISAIFEIWFFVVILKLYRYYKEKRLSSFTSVAQYGYQQQQQPVGPQPEYGNPNQGILMYMLRRGSMSGEYRYSPVKTANINIHHQAVKF